MKMLSEKNPEIEKAYDTLIDMSGDEGERHASQQREIYLQIEVAKSLLNADMSVEFIAEHTGLSIEEIKRLKND